MCWWYTEAEINNDCQKQLREKSEGLSFLHYFHSVSIENSENFELGIILARTISIFIQIHKDFALNNGIKEEVYFTCRRAQVG